MHVCVRMRSLTVDFVTASYMSRQRARSTQRQYTVTMAEKKSLMEQDDGHYSEEEALIYISDEKHPVGATRKAEVRR